MGNIRLKPVSNILSLEAEDTETGSEREQSFACFVNSSVLSQANSMLAVSWINILRILSHLMDLWDFTTRRDGATQVGHKSMYFP